MTALRDKYSKEVRHHLRRLAGEPFDRELGQTLAKLCEPPRRWEPQELCTKRFRGGSSSIEMSEAKGVNEDERSRCHRGASAEPSAMPTCR